MRLFIAARPPESLRLDLASWARTAWGHPMGLEASTGRRNSTRWVAARSLHVTLRFLGEVPAEGVADLKIALRQSVGRHRRLELVLAGHGCFPRRGRARVALIHLESSVTFAALHAAVSSAVEQCLGLDTESQPFRPHITVARRRRGWTTAEARHWTNTQCPHQGTAFEVTYIDLMESRLSPSGAEYHLIESSPLET